MTNALEDPLLATLAELVHLLRPAWNRPGIHAALAANAHRPVDQLIRAFIDAALDPTARTPAVLASRDGAAFTSSATSSPTTSSTPSGLRACQRCRHFHGVGEPCMRYDADTNERGLATTRAAFRVARAAARTAAADAPTDDLDAERVPF